MESTLTLKKTASKTDKWFIYIVKPAQKSEKVTFWPKIAKTTPQENGLGTKKKNIIFEGSL